MATQWLISDIPNQFSPRHRLIAFLDRMKTHPDPENEDVVRVRARVQGHLDDLDRKEASKKAASTKKAAE